MKKVVKLINTGLIVATFAMSAGLFGAMGAPAPAAPTPDEQLYRAIQVAMENGDIKFVKKFIKNAKLNVNAQYGDPRDTLLIIAARAGNVDAVDYLIAEKSDVNAENNQGESVLIAALRYNPDGSEGFFESEEEADKSIALDDLAQEREEEVLKKLGSKRRIGGAMTIIEDFLYRTPSANIVKRLLAAGAKAGAVITIPNSMPVSTNTALSEAAQSGDAESVKLLIAAGGVDVNYATLPDQRTPLMEGSDDADICTALINAGALVNAQDKDGRTPLIYAAMSACEECGSKHKNGIRVLLQAGADATIQDNFGKTVFEYAKRQPEIIELLQKYASYSGETKAQEAWSKEHKEKEQKSAAGSVENEAKQQESDVEEPALAIIDEEPE